MNNRICPSDATLSEYLGDTLTPECKASVEAHLALCTRCQKLLVETQEILNKPYARGIIHNIVFWIKTNRWLIASTVTLTLSFLASKYFLQFLVASILTGAKWIIDSKTTKTLIMIQKAIQSGDNEETKSILSKINR